jgi:hypothetical protein
MLRDIAIEIYLSRVFRFESILDVCPWLLTSE